MREMKNDDFQVGDLVTLKHHRGNPDAPPPLAVVVSLAAYYLDRIQIQFFDTSGPEMAAPEHWIVVSHAK
jgi:hypothetical protein